MSQFSKKQIDSLVNSDARINIWEGAVRSGKTYISLYRFLKELIPKKDEFGNYIEETGEYCIITRTLDSFKRNILPLLARMISADARYYSGKREMDIWGKTIHIVGADDERAENKIRGSTFSGAYVDEATIIPETVFKMLISRCAMNGGKIFATTNPDSPFHWLKRDFLTDNPDVKSWQFTLNDNPELTNDEKEYLKRQYKGVWHQRFIEGLWVQAQGAIYDFFDPKIHVIDNSPGVATYYIVGIDYGTTNPCSFVLIGINRSKFPNMWVEEVYYYDSKIAQRQKTDTEYAADFARFITGRNVKAIYIDPSAVSFKLELQKSGISNIYEAQNEVIDGIRIVSKFLDNGTLKICSKCEPMIKEIQSYVWDPKCQKTGEDKPLKTSDHSLDALRYCIVSHFMGRETQGLSASDIDKIYSEAMGAGQSLPAPFDDSYDTRYRF
jgi:PBSX family phage terminase large subunit